jgi:hypothetical protein
MFNREHEEERLRAEMRVAAQNVKADHRLGYLTAPLALMLCIAVGIGLDQREYWFAATAFVGAVLLGLTAVSLITTKAPK